MTYFNNPKIKALVKTIFASAVFAGGFSAIIWLAKNYTDATFIAMGTLGVLWFLYSTYSYYLTVENNKNKNYGKS
jgi:hypothetical protein